MMKWLPIALALTLSACSSAPETRYYQLPTSAAAEVVSRTVTQPVWIERVSVPDYLAGNGVVYQSNDVQFVIAASNQWASPLDQQLQQALVSNLNAALPAAIVTASPPGEQHDTLNVTVTGFHGRYDGRAVVSGEWILKHNGQMHKQVFMLALPQDEDGYDALVRTLAKGWQQVSGQIANQIIRER